MNVRCWRPVSFGLRLGLLRSYWSPRISAWLKAVRSLKTGQMRINAICVACSPAGRYVMKRR